MAIEVNSNAKPKATIDVETFKEHSNNGEYYGIPLKYFEVTSNAVYLKPKLASKLKWNIDGELPNSYNVNAMTQTVNIDGKTLQINPGFFCSYIKKKNVK